MLWAAGNTGWADCGAGSASTRCTEPRMRPACLRYSAGISDAFSTRWYTPAESVYEHGEQDSASIGAATARAACAGGGGCGWEASIPRPSKRIKNGDPLINWTCTPSAV